MKKIALFIGGIIIGAIIGGGTLYYYLTGLYNEKYEIIKSDFYKSILPDNADLEIKDTLNTLESTDIKITITKDGEKMALYTGTIGIKIIDENGKLLKEDTDYSIVNNGIYSFQPSDLSSKEFQKGLTINKEGNFYIEIEDLNENKILGKFPINVINNQTSKNNQGLAPTIIIEIDDTDGTSSFESDEYNPYIYEDEESFINSTNHTTSILPDSAEITLKDPIISGEHVNFKIKIMKNGLKLDNYEGTIIITVTDLNGLMLKDNEYTAPSRGMYTFLPSDLGEKEFQKGLTINKEGEFYIEVQDLNENEDKILGRQLVTVVKPK